MSRKKIIYLDKQAWGGLNEAEEVSEVTKLISTASMPPWNGAHADWKRAGKAPRHLLVAG